MGQFRKPFGLAWPAQRLLIPLSPHLVAVVPSYSLPLSSASVTRTELVGTAWTLAYEVSKVGNNRKDALELEILSKDKNEVK